MAVHHDIVRASFTGILTLKMQFSAAVYSISFSSPAAPFGAKFIAMFRIPFLATTARSRILHHDDLCLYSLTCKVVCCGRVQDSCLSFSLDILLFLIVVVVVPVHLEIPFTCGKGVPSFLVLDRS